MSSLLFYKWSKPTLLVFALMQYVHAWLGICNASKLIQGSSVSSYASLPRKMGQNDSVLHSSISGQILWANSTLNITRLYHSLHNSFASCRSQGRKSLQILPFPRFVLPLQEIKIKHNLIFSKEVLTSFCLAPDISSLWRFRYFYFLMTEYL